MTITNYILHVIKINYVVFGGASLTTPFYYKYYVDTGIIPETDINNYLTMANILPGAMSFYMTAYTGLFFFGFKGVLIGLTTLLLPIMIITLLVFEFLNYIPFDINLLIYVSLPIMIIASIDFLNKVFKSELDMKFKLSIFGVSFFLLITALTGTIFLILSFILIVVLLNRKEPHVTDYNN